MGVQVPRGALEIIKLTEPRVKVSLISSDPEQPSKTFWMRGINEDYIAAALVFLNNINETSTRFELY